MSRLLSRVLSQTLVAGRRAPFVTTRGLSSWGPPPKVVPREEIVRRVVSALQKHDKLSSLDLLPETQFSSLGLDSLDVIECIVEIEDEFEVEVDDKDVSNVTSVEAVVGLVSLLLKAREDPARCPDIDFGENMSANRPLS